MSKWGNKDVKMDKKSIDNTHKNAYNIYKSDI